MDAGKILLDILIVLVAAKAAAELAERAAVPAVVGEILAGVVVGPSVLGLVPSTDEVLRILGELGVILLLLDVGLEMDISELRAVGWSSLLTATVGVLAPLAIGFPAMLALGEDAKVALFVAAALTATSVGITARVFGDLRALATTEARIVLGAAVADDVMGLVVLTVVVRLVTEGSVSVLSVLGIIAVAVAFLVVAVAAGLGLAPKVFGLVDRYARNAGTVLALALAFTLAVAQLADAARLAPVVGAFVAGLALNRTAQAERIRRDFTPIGQILVPIFFLQIGIDAEIGAFARVEVLRDAAILLVVAIVGKLVSPAGAAGTKTDKFLIGLGMLPRGEVGLIFATIGLQNGVLGENLFASLLLVVLVTTLMTPPLLRMRYTKLRAARSGAAAIGEPMPEGGWLHVVDGLVRLPATPPAHLGLSIALDAARLVATAEPSEELLAWLTTITPEQVRWDRDATAAFLSVVTEGNARSWRFLDTLGLLEAALPELAATLAKRKGDPLLVDPGLVHSWATIERLRRGDIHRQDEVHAPERLLLAALILDAVGQRPDRVALARQLLRRLDLGAAAEQEVAALVGDALLLWAASRRPDAFTEEHVLELASHFDRPALVTTLYVLSLAQDPGSEEWERDRLGELHDLVVQALAHPELTGLDARNLLEQRRAQAKALVPADSAARARIDQAPRAYMLSQPPAVIARQAALVARADGRLVVTVESEPSAEGHVVIEVTAPDRRGLLAMVTAALGHLGLDVRQATIATWADGRALEAFLVANAQPPDTAVVRDAIEEALRIGPKHLSGTGAKDVTLTFDDAASPWHTVALVKAADEPGLLHALASVFAAADVVVHAARISSDCGIATDHFDLTDQHGAKLESAAKTRIQVALQRGATAGRTRRTAPYVPLLARRRRQSAGQT